METGASTVGLGRLLVVDHDAEFLRTLSEGLAVHGYEVAAATSAGEALAVLRAQDVDVLITALVVPDLTGIALLRAALEIDSHLVGIVLSDDDSVHGAVEAMKEGAFDYVLKPLTARDLLPLLARALEVRRLRRENFQLREAKAIYELSNAVAFTLDLNEILDKVGEAALQQAEADEVSIMLPTAEGNELYVAVARGASRDAILGRRVPLDQGIAGWVARHRELLVLHGQVSDPRFAPIKPRSEIQCAVSVPMMVAGALVGVLNVNATRGPRSFTPGQIKALTVVANIAAAAIKTASLYAQARDAEEKYRAIFENAVEGIYQITPCGRFLSANPALAHMLGYDEPRELMRQITDVGRQLYVASSRWAELVRRLDESNAVFRFESQVKRKDGSVIWISENARAVVDNTGEVRYYEGMVEDITERKRAEAERERSERALRESNRQLESALMKLKQMQQQIIQQERLRALGQMASGVAHDFNNDLAMIVGFSELLLNRPEDLKNVDKARSYLQMIRTVAGDAAAVVDRLREFFRQRTETEAFLPVDVNYLVEQAVLLTQPRWRYQAQANGVTIRVKTDLQPVPSIFGNAADLREALTNLILNAVDAMPRGGTLRLRTRREGNQIVLQVTDTGVGMNEEVRRRCLEPFFTTKGERGTGLGLSMVYGVVERHEGTIEIESEVGRGTTFTLRLPVELPKEMADPPPGPKDRSGGPRHVLVVEDEAPLRRILTEYLAFDGHAVETAANGREGVEKFLQGETGRSPRGKFDLVVTDLAMPEMSGDQLARAIKETAPATPVIMLTGLGEIVRGASERLKGVDLIVSKPVTLATLQQAVARVMN